MASSLTVSPVAPLPARITGNFAPSDRKLNITVRFRGPRIRWPNVTVSASADKEGKNGQALEHQRMVHELPYEVMKDSSPLMPSMSIRTEYLLYASISLGTHIMRF